LRSRIAAQRVGVARHRRARLVRERVELCPHRAVVTRAAERVRVQEALLVGEARIGRRRGHAARAAERRDHCAALARERVRVVRTAVPDCARERALAHRDPRLGARGEPARVLVVDVAPRALRVDPRGVGQAVVERVLGAAPCARGLRLAPRLLVVRDLRRELRHLGRIGIFARQALPLHERLAALERQRVVAREIDRIMRERAAERERQERRGEDRRRADQRAAGRLRHRVEQARDRGEARLADPLLRERERIVGEPALEARARRVVEVVALEEELGGGEPGATRRADRVGRLEAGRHEAGGRPVGTQRALGALERVERSRRACGIGREHRDREIRGRVVELVGDDRRVTRGRSDRRSLGQRRGRRTGECAGGGECDRPPLHGVNRSRSTESANARNASSRRAASIFSGAPSRAATIS
jgi:hypothetical protein